MLIPSMRIAHCKLDFFFIIHSFLSSLTSLKCYFCCNATNCALSIESETTITLWPRVTQASTTCEAIIVRRRLGWTHSRQPQSKSRFTARFHFFCAIIRFNLSRVQYLNDPIIMFKSSTIRLVFILFPTDSWLWMTKRFSGTFSAAAHIRV